MIYGHIIWDFNGTILDDVETGILSVNKLLRDRELPEIADREQYQSVFCFPIKHYYEKLGFNFEKEPYEVVAPLWVEQYMINVKNARVFSDARAAIDVFNSLGIPQTLLSATELEMLKGQLVSLGLSDAFCEVLGREDIHAASKEGIARAWRDRHSGEMTLMIGDTDHDLQVSRAIGVDCVLISRGHQSAEYLRGLGAPVYESVEALLADIL